MAIEARYAASIGHGLAAVRIEMQAIRRCIWRSLRKIFGMQMHEYLANTIRPGIQPMQSNATPGNKQVERDWLI
jgi:hypothetical protein